MLISDKGRVARRTIEPLGSFRRPREKVAFMNQRPRCARHCPPCSALILFDANGVPVPGNKTPVPARRINQTVFAAANRPLQERRDHAVGSIVGAGLLLGKLPDHATLKFTNRSQ
jgi:hypothetical protein